jgi:hypothetical protein
LYIQPYLHKFFQPAQEGSAPFRAHSKKNRANARDKLLMGFQECSAARVRKFNENLAAVLSIPAAFYQSPFFEAIDSAYNCCGVDSQASCDSADSTGFSISGLASLNQAHYHKLRCAKSLLMRVLEAGSHNFAQVREDSNKPFNLLIEQ